MSYLLKKEIADGIKEKYKNSYIKNHLGLSDSYVSLILNRHKAVPKSLAYSFCKVLNSEYEIIDLFERVS